MSSGISPSAVEVADSHNKNQLRTERLWNAAHESGFRFGESVLLDKVLPRIFADTAAVAIYSCDIFRPIGWFDKAVQIIHYHSEELTNKIVDYDFMKAALKVAGFELATDTDASYFPLGWEEGEGDVHFLRGQIFDFSFEHSVESMANRSFKKVLSADELIPKYTQDVLKHNDEWIEINLGESDSSIDLPDNGHLGGLDALQCYSDWLDGRRDFDWIIEYYLNSRVRRKRRSS
jgi:hypothetical protein